MKTDQLSTTAPTQTTPPPEGDPIKYMQVVQHLTPGGIEALALDLMGADAKNSMVISLEGTRAQAKTLWPRLELMGESLRWLGKSPGLKPALILKLVSIFRSYPVQTVHTHHIGPLLYAGIAARLAGVPTLIHTEHDAWHLQSRKRRLLQRAVLWLVAPRLVADATQVANNMVHFLGKRPITVIRNGIDSERFRPGNRIAARKKLGLPEKPRLIGNSGRLEPVKGQRFLIEALAQMPGDCHLAIAGRGSQAQILKQLAQQLGITERVHFLDHIDDMPCFYQALDLFCLPSLNEGFPLSPLEAQACSITTAVTDVGAAKETLCPNTGWLLRPANAASMAETLVAAFKARRESDPRDYVLNTADLRKTREEYSALASCRSPSC